MAAHQPLRVDRATAEVLTAFAVAGVEALLLKGASIAAWLYSADAPREYGDLDLLVRPGDLERARAVLAELGFEPEYDEGALPDSWREHSVAWLRHADGVEVDLHHTIAGVGVDDESLWRALAADRAHVDVGGFPAPALSTPARALHLAVHAAQHGEASGTNVDELELAITRADIATWRSAAQLAATLDATPTFAVGLHLASSGGELARRLRLPSEVPVRVALRAPAPPPGALALEQLARARGLRARLAIVRQKLFPSPAYMRTWSPIAREGRLGLIRAYGRRLVSLARAAPGAANAWRAARRRQDRKP